MSAITIEGDLVHYEKLGRGRPVILVHSWIGSWRYWIPLMQQLHVRFSVYTIDLIGFGDSAKNAGHYALEAQVQLLLRFMEQLAIPKAALIGHGLGALVASQFAQQYPERAARLLLISAPVFDPGNLRERSLAQANVALPTRGAEPTALAQASPAVSAPANPLADLINDRTIYPLLEKCFRRSDPTYEKLRVDMEKADSAALTASTRQFDAGLYLDVLRALACPTVVVHGVDDPVIPAPSDDVWHFLTVDRDEQFVPIPLAGVRHFPMLEYEPFMRLAGDFLDTPEIHRLEVRGRWRRRSR